MQATQFDMSLDMTKENLKAIIEQENAKLTEKLDHILQKNHQFSLLAAQFQEDLTQEIMQSQQLLNPMAARYREDVEAALQAFMEELDTQGEALQTVLLQRETHRLEQEIYQKSTELDVEITLLAQAFNELMLNMQRELKSALEKPSYFAQVRRTLKKKVAPALRKNRQRGRIGLGNVLERFAVKLKAA